MEEMAISIHGNSRNVPVDKQLKKIVINLVGLKKIDFHQLLFLAEVAIHNPQAKIYLLNCEQNIKNQLKIFEITHKNVVVT